MTIPRELSESGAKTAIILGSGLGSFADSLDHLCSLAFDELGLPTSKVPGHAGRLVLARLNDTPLLIAQGRVHLYEGWSVGEVVRTIVLMQQIGINKLILTNAAGSLNPDFEPGSWMMISDHINLTGRNTSHRWTTFCGYDRSLQHKASEMFSRCRSPPREATARGRVCGDAWSPV